eukprot:CAMPEP_0198220520 /NCGR_PEP_ID=MMETSP1445-20131203/79379_1 /TAXON_ID=36898 /ORGANISM="Pyramimonas sp., Strain CCMP2087" /LENGTH=282 /DNA_ID=CAMNT_0043898315 /DNA_START=113 /DNA_END=958 /DNA_ORIENTATION=-
MSSLSEAATEDHSSQGYIPGKNVSLLEYTDPKWDASQKPSKVYILGTSHVSRDSPDEARALIQAVKPDCVVLELCISRKGLLATVPPKSPTLSEMVKLYKAGKLPLWGVIFSMAQVQVGSKMELTPGEEFRVASESASEIGAEVVLGDRPIQATLKRTWAALSVREKCRFIWELMGSFSISAEELEKMVEELKESDMVTQAMKELARDFPSLWHPLITERDLYLVHSLQQAAKKHKVVVGVVGAGHCAGIREHWTSEIDVAELVRLPPEDERSLIVAAAYEW